MTSIAAPVVPLARRLPRGLWVVPPVLLIAGLFLYPLSLIFGQALSGGSPDLSLAYFAKVLGTPAFRSALVHTIEIAVAASAAASSLAS